MESESRILVVWEFPVNRSGIAKFGRNALRSARYSALTLQNVWIAPLLSFLSLDTPALGHLAGGDVEV